MSTLLLARLTETGDNQAGGVCTAPAAGVLHRWIYQPGEHVPAGRAVATVSRADGGGIVEVRTAAAGVLGHRVAEGAGVAAGEPVGHVERRQSVETGGAGPETNGHRNGSQSATSGAREGKASPDLDQIETENGRRETPSAPSQASPERHRIVTKNRRRNGHVAPLVVEELEPEPAPPPRPKPRPKKKRDKVARARFYLLESQHQELEATLSRLNDELPDMVTPYELSELGRVAVALLLGHDQAGLVGLLESQRDDEEAAGVGFGARARRR